MITEGDRMLLGRFEEAAQTLRDLVDCHMRQTIAPLLDALSEVRANVVAASKAAPVMIARAEPARRPAAPPVPPRPSVAPPSGRPAPKRKHARGERGERRILLALAQHPTGITMAKLALLTEYKKGGGGLNNLLSALRTAGKIGRSEPVRILPRGLEALGPFEPLPRRGRALIEHWLGQLGKAEVAALRVLVDVYPRAVPGDELAQWSGYKPGTGGFNNALSRLRTLELIEGRGELRASAALCGAAS